MKIICLLIFLCFLNSTIDLAYAQTVPQDTLIRTGKLANGLTYFIRKNTKPKGQANFYLVQKVGSVLEEENQRGLAHFLEHMAFNGTKHFPDNTMVSELEKNGIKFGSNINAYTGYDETVYRLTNIPVNGEGILDTALLILHDWSGFILNQDKDIDEERGVVREEWRTRSNGYLRVQESQVIPVLLEGTAYANRLPIGSMDIVMNFKYQQLKDYYKKWYVPYLQCIVVVGDIDVDQLEHKLKILFGKIPSPEDHTPRRYEIIPDNKHPIIAIASDPEIRSASAMVYWRQKSVSSEQRKSIQFFKTSIINNLISNLINQRFTDFFDRGKSWNSVSTMGTYSVAHNVPAWTLDVITTDDKVLGALKADLVEMERIRRFGFTKNELDPTVRKFHLMLNETNLYDRQQSENAEFGEGIIKQFLTDETFPDQSWKYKMTHKILSELTIDTLSFYVKKYLSSTNLAVAILYPVKKDLPLPSKNIVLDLLESIKKTHLKPWVKESKADEFASLTSPQAPKIICTRHNISPFGFTNWELSNGVKVWFKNTGYRESKVMVFGFKSGGYSQVSLKKLPAALAYNQIVGLTGGFEGSGGIMYRGDLNQYATYVTSVGNVMNLKLLFQNIYLQMTRFKTEPKTFENWRSRKLEEIKSGGIIPKEAFRDTLNAIMSNHNPRAISILNDEVLNQISYHDIRELHHAFFGNAKDFNFIIVGNLNIDTVEQLSKTWLGGLPYQPTSSSKIVDHEMYPPQGIIRKQFSRKMKTPQSTITIGYTGEIPYTLENKVMITIVSDVLKRKYTQEIREKEGGTYGVGVYADLVYLPKERYVFQINFDTAPDPLKKKHLLDIVYREIDKLQNFGPDTDDLNVSKHSYLKTNKEGSNEKNAKYWYDKQGMFLLYGKDFNRDYNQILSEVDPKKMQDFAKRIFEQGNLIEVVMDPK